MVKKIQELTMQLEEMLKVKTVVKKRIDEVYDKRDEVCENGMNTDDEVNLVIVCENQGMHLENILKLLKKIDKQCKEMRELEEDYPNVFK